MLANSQRRKVDSAYGIGSRELPISTETVARLLARRAQVDHYRACGRCSSSARYPCSPLFSLLALLPLGSILAVLPIFSLDSLKSLVRSRLKSCSTASKKKAKESAEDKEHDNAYIFHKNPFVKTSIA